MPVRPTRGFIPKGGFLCDVMDDCTSHTEDNVVGTAGQPNQHIMLRARHNESFLSFYLLIKALDSRRNVIGKDIAPKLGPKTNDEVHSSSRGPWFADGGDCSCELLFLLRVQNVKFQVRVRGRSKREYSSLRRVHHASSELFRYSWRCFLCGYRGYETCDGERACRPNYLPTA